MAIVQPVQVSDLRTKETTPGFMVWFQQSPTFEDRETAERAAEEINEVLKRLGGQFLN